MSDYKPDQDTQLEILEEWHEPEEYDHDDCWHDEIARDDFYNPNRRVSKIKNDNSNQRKANNMQLVNTQNQINTIQPSSPIIHIDQINYEKIDNDPSFVSACEKIDNDPILTDEEKINKKIKYQNIVGFSNELKKYSLEQFAKYIYHYTTEMRNPVYQKYGIRVDEEYYKKVYHYYIGYIREKNSSRRSGYDTKMVGFAHISSLVWYPSDKGFRNPTYGIEVDNPLFIKDVNQLFEMLEEEVVNSVSTGTASKPADKNADLDYAYLMLFNEIDEEIDNTERFREVKSELVIERFREVKSELETEEEREDKYYNSAIRCGKLSSFCTTIP